MISAFLLEFLEVTYNNIEILLIDDGSTDQCGIICDNYAKIDKRIRTVYKPNGGVFSARNLDLDYAKCVYQFGMKLWRYTPNSSLATGNINRSQYPSHSS
jgi:hypothetical protein